MAEINYDEIRTEYISSDVSLTSLAKRYGIPKATLARRAKKEAWETIRETTRDKAVQKVEETTIESRVSIATRCIRILDKLVDKVEESVDIVEPSDISAKRQLIGMMKDLHEMGAFELENSNKSNEITIRFAEEVDEYV